MSSSAGPRRLRPHHHDRPSLSIDTTAPPELALDVLTEVLVAARFVVQRREPGRVRLRVGSWLRWQVADSLDVDLLPRLATWGFRATVDLEARTGAPRSQVRVRMHHVTEHRKAVPYVVSAVEVALRRLRAQGYDAAAGEVG